MEERVRALESHVVEQSLQVARLERERDEYKKLVVLLREENERLKRGLLGQKAERLPSNDAQLSLAIMGLVMGSSDAAAETAALPEPDQVIPEHTRAKSKRPPRPDELPKVTIEMIPPEVQREGSTHSSSSAVRSVTSSNAAPLRSFLSSSFTRSSCAKDASATRPLSSSSRRR